MELKDMVKGKKYQIHYKIPAIHRRESRMMVGTYLGQLQPRQKPTLVFDLTPERGTVEIETAWILDVAWTSGGTKNYYDVKVQ